MLIEPFTGVFSYYLLRNENNKDKNKFSIALLCNYNREGSQIKQSVMSILHTKWKKLAYAL